MTQPTGIENCLETVLTLRARFGATIEQRMLAFDALRALKEKQREEERKKRKGERQAP